LASFYQISTYAKEFSQKKKAQNSPDFEKAKKFKSSKFYDNF